MDFVWKPSVETVLQYISTLSGLTSVVYTEQNRPTLHGCTRIGWEIALYPLHWSSSNFFVSVSRYSTVHWSISMHSALKFQYLDAHCTLHWSCALLDGEVLGRPEAPPSSWTGQMRPAINLIMLQHCRLRLTWWSERFRHGIIASEFLQESRECGRASELIGLPRVKSGARGIPDRHRSPWIKWPTI